MRTYEGEAWNIKKEIEGYVKAPNLSQSPVGGMAPQNISTATAQKPPTAPSATANKEETLDSLVAKFRK